MDKPQITNRLHNHLRDDKRITGYNEKGQQHHKTKFISFFNFNFIKQETQLQLGNRHRIVGHGPQEYETEGQNLYLFVFIT